MPMTVTAAAATPGRRWLEIRCAISIGALLASAAMALLPLAPAQAETLEEALTFAFQNNPSFAAQQADTRASDEPARQARAAFGPTIQGSISYSYQKDTLISGGAVSGEGWGPDFRIQASQPLYTFGRLSSQLRQARNLALEGREALRSSEMLLLSNVIGVYVAVRRDKLLVDIAQQNVTLLEDQLTQTDVKFQYRDATTSDVARTSARLAFGRGQLVAAQGSYQASREAYRAVVGHYPDDLAVPTPLPVLPGTLIEAYELGEQKNADYLTAQHAEAASRAEVGAARAQRLPSISATASLDRGPYALTQFGNDVRHTFYTAGISADMPLFTSGLLSSRIREVKDRNERDFFRVEEARRRMRQDIAENWDNLAASRQAAPQYAQAVQAADQAVTSAKVQAKAGYLTTLDVLDATRDLLTSRQEQARNEANLYILQANLLKAIGVLDIEALTASASRKGPKGQDLHFEGLPTGPIIHAADVTLILDGVHRPPLQKEKDEVAVPMPPAP